MTGHVQTGLAAAELSLGMGTRLWEAEARRLRAEFLAALGASATEVEAELERALAVARGQGAKSLELRVAVSLLRHRRERGDGLRARETRELLAAIVEELPEGRETRDLREAARILTSS